MIGPGDKEGIQFIYNMFIRLWAFFCEPHEVFGFYFSFFGIFVIHVILMAFGFLVFKLTD